MEKSRFNFVCFFIVLTYLFLFILLGATIVFLYGMDQFSIHSLISPYSGNTGIISCFFALMCLGAVLLYHFYFLPSFFKKQNGRIIALIFPKIFVILGFFVGFLSGNFWAFVPYAIIGLLNYFAVYLKSVFTKM